MSFLKFLSELPNLEKTRNFNVFKNYDLSLFQEFVTDLGDFQNNKLTANRISVVGTNGKGSTAFFLSHLLKSTVSKKVGTYTSPHLLHVLERIALNLEPISEDRADLAFSQIQAQAKKNLDQLSYFECLTLIAFQVFNSENCDWEIWEAGLGGRLDATKLAHAETVVLTKIGLDHCEILGNTPEKIAQEKISIAGPKAKKLFFLEQGNRPLDEFIKRAGEALGMEVFLFQIEKDIPYLETNKRFAKFVLEHLGVFIPNHVLETKVLVPGRMEIIRRQPLIVFEPAHNPDAVYVSVAEVKPQVLFLGILPDKDGHSILQNLETLFPLQIYLIEAPGYFSWENHPYSGKHNLQRLPLVDLIEVLEKLEEKALVLGSFRLYSQLQSLSIFR